MSITALVPLPAQTEKGSALHEAALFGKTDVVQRLLAAGQRRLHFLLPATTPPLPSPNAFSTVVQQVST